MREKSAAKDKELKKNEKLLQQIEVVSNHIMTTHSCFFANDTYLTFVSDSTVFLLLIFRKQLVAIRKI